MKTAGPNNERKSQKSSLHQSITLQILLIVIACSIFLSVYGSRKHVLSELKIFSRAYTVKEIKNAFTGPWIKPGQKDLIRYYYRPLSILVYSFLHDIFQNDIKALYKFRLIVSAIKITILFHIINRQPFFSRQLFSTFLFYEILFISLYHMLKDRDVDRNIKRGLWFALALIFINTFYYFMAIRSRFNAIGNLGSIYILIVIGSHYSRKLYGSMPSIAMKAGVVLMVLTCLAVYSVYNVKYILARKHPVIVSLSHYDKMKAKKVFRSYRVPPQVLLP